MVDKFEKITMQAIDEINKLLVQSESESSPLPYYMSRSQLKAIIDELLTMNQTRNAKEFFPYYPKGIADCWNYDDMLGNKLLNIIDIYKKL